MTRIAQLLAVWFGAGLLPKAPGTWGSLAALPLAYAIAYWGSLEILSGATIIVFVVGVWASEVTSRAMGVTDPSEIVIDEVAGQWLTLLVVPPDLILYAIGFLLFRLFDIWKPWPISWADQKIKGGMGIMLDDVIAGVYAGVLLWVGQVMYLKYVGV
ncbi:MAG: phosphatidylglycerophosphatase A [Rhodospirillaceae bacterium]|jgi:phosphatidylglycerophosphatase A|nr:phosphatidylglycerophosphatase A [Rhodospirillaceae bacterium]MBT4940860.1 phosphatidylglycerophosphatase A [Rhodospirillaceae bacterium]MBT5940610.1 phosphatidylglycerophosphatase A [Rhodospirillaceae bacterium]MBT7268673.1 phosphatidylglycerophosphatase A [Rhodospirillaceae bacterium]